MESLSEFAHLYALGVVALAFVLALLITVALVAALLLWTVARCSRRS